MNSNEKQKLVTALHRVWDYIASDYLELCPRGRCKGAEVQEAVGDRVDYMSPADLAAFSALTRSEQDELLGAAFPAKTTYSY